MEIVSTNSALPAEKHNTPSWLDLLLYLVVGIGGFFATSVVVRSFVHAEQVSLPISLIAYALNLIFFAGTTLVLGAARGKLDLRAIGFFPPRLDWKWFTAAIAISLALLPLRGLIGAAVQYLAAGGLESMERRMSIIAPDGFTWLGFLVTLIGAGILVPISEELFFRGALFTWFRAKYNFPIAMLASSTIFALGHFDAIGVVASSFVLALVNAYVFEKSKNLWAPILMHITTNSVAVLFIYAALAWAPDLMQR